MSCPITPPAPVEDDAEIITTTFLRGLRWAAVAMNLIILLCRDLPNLLAHQEAYRSVFAQLVALGGFIAVTLVIAVAMWWGRGVGRWRWPLLALVFALSVLATEYVSPEYRLGPAHWSDGDAQWSAVLLLLDSRAAVFAGALACQYLATFVHVALDGQMAVSMAGAVNGTVNTLAYQVTVGMIAVVLRGLAVSSARLAREREQLRTAEEVAERLHQDRKARCTDLAGTTVPLLEGLASGRLDPGETSVRRACAVEAAKMRRLFAEEAVAPDPLSAELRACIDLAERNGVSVSFAEYGPRPAFTPSVRRALTEPAVAALATARGKVRLTVAGTKDTVTVSVVADCPPHAVPTRYGDAVVTSTVTEGKWLWVQATWRGAT
jgi:hypothetical protein